MEPEPRGIIVGLGDAVMDIVATISYDHLIKIAKEPGGCILVDALELEQLLQDVAHVSELKRIPGGSAANVLKGIANISKTLRCKFMGMIGNDVTGRDYNRQLAQENIEPLLLESNSGVPSACSLCLVTPDGQRTMRTCLGAALELQEAAQLAFPWDQGISLLHSEGYCLYRPQLAMQVMRQAKEAGALVSLDLASFELVRHCKDSLQQLLQSGCLDLVFANEQEAITLCNQLNLTSIEASNEYKVEMTQAYLLKYIQVSVVSLGAKGCIARSKDGQVACSTAPEVTVKDTIGAGDFFTAGFLSAYLAGASLQCCAVAGCAAGSEAVQAVGAELDAAAKARLQLKIKGLVEGFSQASPRPQSLQPALQAVDHVTPPLVPCT